MKYYSCILLFRMLFKVILLDVWLLIYHSPLREHTLVNYDFDKLTTYTNYAHLMLNKTESNIYCIPYKPSCEDVIH